MTPERQSLLNSIGFCWRTRDAQWNEMFAQLQAFHAEHGHTNVPFTPATQRLWHWMYMQRRRQQGMTSERRARLDSIGFQW